MICDWISEKGSECKVFTVPHKCTHVKPRVFMGNSLAQNGPRGLVKELIFYGFTLFCWMNRIGLGDKRYHIEIVVKIRSMIIISSGHFYSSWINLTSYHTAEINVTAAVSAKTIEPYVCMLCVSLCERMACFV